MLGPKNSRSVDLKKSDYELFCEHLPEIQDDPCVDASWQGLKPVAAKVLLSLLWLKPSCKANLGSVIRYVIGCRTLSFPGHWDPWLE